MLFYKYLARYLPNSQELSLNDIFWKEKIRIIKKWLNYLDLNNYTYWIESLNKDNLNEFYYLYSDYISRKQNPHVFDLIEKYSNNLNEDWKQLYLGYIRKDWKLIGWGLFIYKINRDKNTLMLWYRAVDPNVLIEKLKLWYYIEYLFFNYGKQLCVDSFSRGRDRNWYGILGSDIWICIHKLQLKFLPYLSSNKEMIELDEKSLSNELLLFSGSDEYWRFNEVILRTNKSLEEIENKYWFIRKRWINLIIKSFTDG